MKEAERVGRKSGKKEGRRREEKEERKGQKESALFFFIQKSNLQKFAKRADHMLSALHHSTNPSGGWEETGK